MLQTAREEYVLRRIRNEMRGADIPVEFSKGEAGRGQHEVNVTYDEALSMADRHLVFKNGIKEIAAQEGRAATFMAKWTMDDVGSSCHVHTSLWDLESGEPLMADPSDPAALSTLGRRFLAGQIHAARELAWCSAPTVNSYRRYVPGSWAPTAAVWGEDNRTCGFRVVGHGAGRRVESRIPGADVNPYIVLAASIAAGLYGIDHDLDPGEPYPVNAYEATDVPRDPVDAGGGDRGAALLGGGARGVRAGRAPPPVEHGRAGVVGVEPPRLGLGAGPELRADLRGYGLDRGRGRVGRVGRAGTPVRSPGHGAALATVLGRVAAFAGLADLGGPSAAHVGRERRRLAGGGAGGGGGGGGGGGVGGGGGGGEGRRDIMLHRKMWEWLFVAEALHERGMLAPGRSGLGLRRGPGAAGGFVRRRGLRPRGDGPAAPAAVRAGWTDSSSEWAGGLENLDQRAAVRPGRVRPPCDASRTVDMNAPPRRPPHRGRFDFTWSSCALEHLGTLAAGADFVVAQMDCLRPGGVAVHTTEYLVACNGADGRGGGDGVLPAS